MGITYHIWDVPRKTGKSTKAAELLKSRNDAILVVPIGNHQYTSSVLRNKVRRAGSVLCGISTSMIIYDEPQSIISDMFFSNIQCLSNSGALHIFCTGIEQLPEDVRKFITSSSNCIIHKTLDNDYCVQVEEYDIF